MTTLEFMEKELEKLERHKKCAIARNAPAVDIKNLETKKTHYEKVCELLRKEKNNANI